MRYLTLKQRLQLARHAANSLKAKLRWKEWRRVKRGGIPKRRVRVFTDGKRMMVNARGRIAMPRVFCLDENLEETMQTLHQMRRIVLGEAVAHQRREAIVLVRDRSRRRVRDRQALGRRMARAP